MKYTFHLKKTALLLLFFLPVWPLAPGLCAPIALAEPSSTPKDFDFLPQRSVSADFDGDHRADIASGIYDGQMYRVEIKFCTGKSPASITFPSSCPRFNILALDIDDDNDQDLVIVSASSSSPPEVWLNDGKGHFEHGSRWWWATLLTSDDSPGFDSSGSRSDPASMSQDRRSLFQSSAAPHGMTLEVHYILSQTSHSKFTRIVPSGPSNRDPPLDYTLQLNSQN
jgi:hypothetical protein